MCAYSAVRVFCFLINYQIQYVLSPNRLTTFGCRACTEWSYLFRHYFLIHCKGALFPFVKLLNNFTGSHYCLPHRVSNICMKLPSCYMVTQADKYPRL